MIDARFLRVALRLAQRGFGTTSPNPMVGAVLVKAGKIIGRGWHRRAGAPHAEVEAINDAQSRGFSPRGATLYVTLEPCSTQGRTPPCTEILIAAGVKRVVVGTIDPNPKHAGRGLTRLQCAGIQATRLDNPRSRRRRREHKVLADACETLNEAFNHWITRGTPFVTVKAAMTLDGKIAAAHGESRWITGELARAFGRVMRWGCDAILVGVNTVLADDPSLTRRGHELLTRGERDQVPLRRIILDSRARTPPTARVVSDEHALLTTIVVSRRAPNHRVAALARRVRVWRSPPGVGQRATDINLAWLLRQLGRENVTRMLVEGGGEVNASFLLGGFAQRVAFFYAPKIMGGRDARRAVAGDGTKRLSEIVKLEAIAWRKLGPDLLLTGRVCGR